MSQARIHGPDDPRHGSNAGYGAGCREECCMEARRVYDRESTRRRRARLRVNAEAHLAALLAEEPEGSAEAACQRPGVDPDWFYEPDVERHYGREPHAAKVAREAKAKAVCALCGRRAKCLSDSIEERDEWSIRGGLTARERRPFLTTAAA